MKNEIKNLEEDTKQVQAQRDKELRKGGRFQALEEDVKTKSHEVVRLTTVLDLKATSIAEEQGKYQTLETTVKELDSSLKERTIAYEKLKGGHDTAKSEFDALNTEVTKKDELLQTLLTGVASKEGQESGYQSQLQGGFSPL